MEPNTVTLSLQDYEAMKSELQHLRQQVQEKTIVKKAFPMWVEVIIMGIFSLGMAYFITKF